MVYTLLLKKYVLNVNECGVMQENKTFKRFNDSKRLLDRSQYFKVIKDKKVSALVPKSWKKSFFSGIILPTKMRFCNECNDEKM